MLWHFAGQRHDAVSRTDGCRGGDCSLEFSTDERGHQTGSNSGVRQHRRAKTVGMSPLSALMLAQLTHEVGFPPGVVNVIHGTGLGPVVARSTSRGRQNHIHWSTSDGRPDVGSSQDRNEGGDVGTGGKNTQHRISGSPIESVVNGVITGIFFNLGQVCVAGSRLLVQESQHDDLMERIVAKVKSLRQGHPTDASNHLGCLATPQHLATVDRYVERAKLKGARCVLTGPVSKDVKNCFYPPTIFDRVTSPMCIAARKCSARS